MVASARLMLVVAVAVLAACGGKSGGGAESAGPGDIPGDATGDVPADVVEAGDAAVDAPAEARVDIGPPGCDPSSAAGLAACVSEPNWEADLAFIATPRDPGSPHWQEVQDLCARRFKDLGYTVELQAYGTGGIGVNVIGTKLGGARPDEHVIVSAHYDHIKGCAGADDNGSGAAGTLEAARVLSYGTWDRTLVVACWDQEEDGLIGSGQYALRAKKQGDDIVAAYVFEMIGFESSEPNSQTIPPGFDLLFPDAAKYVTDNDSKGDFLAVITDEASATQAGLMADQGKADGLPVLVLTVTDDLKTNPAIMNLLRSDHASFWMNDFPGMMITDTSEFRNPNYHCKKSPDTADTLTPAFAANVVRAAVASASQTLGMSK